MLGQLNPVWGKGVSDGSGGHGPGGRIWGRMLGYQENTALQGQEWFPSEMPHSCRDGGAGVKRGRGWPVGSLKGL